MDRETLAVIAVMRAISRTGRLVPFFNANDRGPIWDGYVAVYATPEKNHRKDDLIARVPVQVKGHERDKPGGPLRYPVESADLQGFSTEGVTVFFVYSFDAKGENGTLFYKVFKTEDVAPHLREMGEQKTKSFDFARFPTDADGAEAVFVPLAKEKANAKPGSAALPVTAVPAPASDTELFLYNAGIVGFYGRERELAQLDAFLTSPGAFRWWGVIGPGGAGKSRLAYEWGKRVRKRGWTVRFLKSGDYKRLDALAEEHPGPLLLIADYARQHAGELGQWMETLCGTERESPLRLLLLERDEGAEDAGEPQWEKELYSAGNEGHLRAARHEKLLQLSPLEDRPLLALITAFAAVLRQRDTSLPALTEEDAETLLEKLGEIDEELRSPLYAMILTDAYLRDPAAARWTQEKLLDRLVLREREQTKTAVRALRTENARLDETLVQAALRLRCLATALGASGDRELRELLALDKTLGELFEKKAEQYNIPSGEELLLYLGLLRYAGGRLLVPALRPDLMGEYALLHWLTEAGTHPGEKEAFYAAALQDRELVTFFQRLYADNAPLLNAKPERWQALLPAELKLDDKRASLYTHLLYDGFDCCTDRAQRGYLLSETARLANSVQEDTPATGDIFNNLGRVYASQGDYQEALRLLQRALTIRENKLDPDHPDTAESYNSLGLVYCAQGEYSQAREAHQNALEIYKKVFGEEHPDTAASYSNIGEVYRAIGDYSAALEFHETALKIRVKVLGVKHPDTAASYHCLCLVYTALGNATLALEYGKKAQIIYESFFGTEHISVASVYCTLGLISCILKDYSLASEYYHRALKIYETILGTLHPKSITCSCALSDVLLFKRDFENAEELLEHLLQALRIAKLVNDPRMAEVQYHLASLRLKTGRDQEAEELFRSALSIRQSELGLNHPDTAVSLFGLADALARQGRVEEAKDDYMKALSVQEGKLGSKHPSTIMTMDKLAGILFELGALLDALKLAESVQVGSYAFRDEQYRVSRGAVHSIFDQISKKDNALSRFRTSDNSQSS